VTNLDLTSGPDDRCPPQTVPQPLRQTDAAVPGAVASPAVAGQRLPPPGGAGELGLQPVGKLGPHIGHGRPLQGQGLLGGQPTQPPAREVAALPAGDHRTGGRLRIHPDLAPGVGGPGRSSMVRSARNTSSPGARSG
jgi:hypothetical protein